MMASVVQQATTATNEIGYRMTRAQTLRAFISELNHALRDPCLSHQQRQRLEDEEDETCRQHALNEHNLHILLNAFYPCSTIVYDEWSESEIEPEGSLPDMEYPIDVD